MDMSHVGGKTFETDREGQVQRHRGRRVPGVFKRARRSRIKRAVGNEVMTDTGWRPGCVRPCRPL